MKVASPNGGLAVPPRTSSSGLLAKLWKQAVEDFLAQALLSKEERASLENCQTPEEAFNLTMHGWEKNIVEKRLRDHQESLKTVSQVLKVFGIIDAVLGLAAVVP
jgi:hypothetical protein